MHSPDVSRSSSDCPFTSRNLPPDFSFYILLPIIAAPLFAWDKETDLGRKIRYVQIHPCTHHLIAYSPLMNLTCPAVLQIGTALILLLLIFSLIVVFLHRNVYCL